MAEPQERTYDAPITPREQSQISDRHGIARCCCMKYSLLFTVIIFSTSLLAQEVPVPTTNDPIHREVPQYLEQERNALSGSLKELLGQVHDKLGSIDNALQRATTDKTNDVMAQHRILLTEAGEDLDSALVAVNSAEPTQWEATKSDAEDVMSSVKELLNKIGTTTSAVN